MIDMAMGNDNDERFVRDLPNGSPQVADAHAAVDQHGFFPADQYEQARAIKFIDLPGILFKLNHGVKVRQHNFFNLPLIHIRRSSHANHIFLNISTFSMSIPEPYPKPLETGRRSAAAQNNRISRLMNRPRRAGKKAGFHRNAGLRADKNQEN
jgi:hypothetical protein